MANGLDIRESIPAILTSIKSASLSSFWPFELVPDHSFQINIPRKFDWSTKKCLNFKHFERMRRFCGRSLYWIYCDKESETYPIVSLKFENIWLDQNPIQSILSFMSIQRVAEIAGFLTPPPGG